MLIVYRSWNLEANATTFWEYFQRLLPRALQFPKSGSWDPIDIQHIENAVTDSFMLSDELHPSCNHLTISSWRNTLYFLSHGLRTTIIIIMIVRTANNYGVFRLSCTINGHVYESYIHVLFVDVHCIFLTTKSI